MTPAAYPLAWPEAFARRTSGRETGKFKTSLSAALDNVRTSLRLFGADSNRRVEDVVISSNVTLGVNSPPDPGVAVWFKWDGLQVCIPVDRYAKVEGNLQAIHHIIEARRVELRHGTLALVRATFQGFAALPAPKARGWREVMGVNGMRPMSAADIESLFKALAKTRHPDAGGSDAAMAELNRARAEALKEIGQ